LAFDSIDKLVSRNTRMLGMIADLTYKQIEIK